MWLFIDPHFFISLPTIPSFLSFPMCSISPLTLFKLGYEIVDFYMAFHTQFFGSALLITPCSSIPHILLKPFHHPHSAFTLPKIYYRFPLMHSSKGFFLVSWIPLVFQVKYQIFEVRICMRKDMMFIFLGLSYVTRDTFSSSIYLPTNFMIPFFFSCIVFHCAYGPYFSYPFISGVHLNSIFWQL